MRFYIIAGEASGDLIGSQIMESLKDAFQESEIYGVGGPMMTNCGLSSLFPMEELSVMGFTEVLPHLPKILGRMNDVVADIEKKRPDILISIDSPDFSFRVCKKVRQKKLNIQIFHVSAPTVWAWRPGRAKKVAAIYDHMFCLFPFEPPYFEKVGLSATFIGHPLCDILQPFLDLEKPQNGPLCLMPGSRRSEITRMTPLFCEIINSYAHIAKQGIVLPTLPHLKDDINNITKNFNLDIDIITDTKQKYSAIHQSRLAIAASGTVSLELALLQTPMIIGYKVNWLSSKIAKMLIKTPYVSLVNILLKNNVVPELLQEKCSVSNFLQAIQDQEAIANQTEQLQKIRTLLKASHCSNAGEAVVKTITLKKLVHSF